MSNHKIILRKLFKGANGYRGRVSSFQATKQIALPFIPHQGLRIRLDSEENNDCLDVVVTGLAWVHKEQAFVGNLGEEPHDISELSISDVGFLKEYLQLIMGFEIEPVDDPTHSASDGWFMAAKYFENQ